MTSIGIHSLKVATLFSYDIISLGETSLNDSVPNNILKISCM